MTKNIQRDMIRKERNMGMKDIDKNFKDNIDALKELMEIAISDDNDKYEKAKDWLISKEYNAIYDYLLEHNLRKERLQQNIFDTYFKNEEIDNKQANCKGCFMVMKSRIKVGDFEIDRNEVLRTRLENMFKKIFKNKKPNIFVDKAGNYVFRLEDDYNYDELGKSANCERLKELMNKWEVGTQALKNQMTFEGAIEIATGLKRLVPLNYDYSLADGTCKTVYKQAEDLKSDYRVIDSQVFEYLFTKNSVGTGFDEWIEKYIKLLYELKFSETAIVELKSNLDCLMNSNKSLYALTVIQLYIELEDINRIILDDIKWYRSHNCDRIDGKKIIMDIIERSELDNELKMQIIEYIEKEKDKSGVSQYKKR